MDFGGVSRADVAKELVEKKDCRGIAPIERGEGKRRDGRRATLRKLRGESCNASCAVVNRAELGLPCEKRCQEPFNCHVGPFSRRLVAWEDQLEMPAAELFIMSSTAPMRG